MGRPSLAPQRRAELLDAALQAILQQGIEGATVARIAEIAGVQPSLVHHYLGTRDQILSTTVARALENVEGLLAESLETSSAEERLARQLDAVFGGRTAAPEINQLIDQLIASSYLDPTLRTEVAAMYARFAEVLEATFELAFPAAPKAHRSATARAVLALAHACPTLQWLDIVEHDARELRAAADLLIDRLRKA